MLLCNPIKYLILKQSLNWFVTTSNGRGWAAKEYIRARWRGWKGIIWFVSGLGYSGLRSASSFSVGAEGATTVSGSSAASLARDTSYKHAVETVERKAASVQLLWQQDTPCCVIYKEQNTHLVSKGFEFTGRAGIQVHELVPIYKQSSFFALVLVLEGRESPALHFQNTGQVSYVALKSQEPSPDLAEEWKKIKNQQTASEISMIALLTCVHAHLINAWHYPDFSGDKLPEVRTRSNRTLVLLSSGERRQKKNRRLSSITMTMMEQLTPGHHCILSIKLFCNSIEKTSLRLMD